MVPNRLPWVHTASAQPDDQALDLVGPGVGGEVEVLAPGPAPRPGRPGSRGRRAPSRPPGRGRGRRRANRSASSAVASTRGWNRSGTVPAAPGHGTAPRPVRLGTGYRGTVSLRCARRRAWPLLALAVRPDLRSSARRAARRRDGADLRLRAARAVARGASPERPDPHLLDLGGGRRRATRGGHAVQEADQPFGLRGRRWPRRRPRGSLYRTAAVPVAGLAPVDGGVGLRSP